MPTQPSGRGTRRSLRIGPYAVEAPLTLGTLGSVYRATDASAGRIVALKVLPPELAASIAARDRFQREAHRARKVRSPNLVNVLDFGDASGTWYLALELVEGPSLADHVQRHGALDGGAARDVLVQAARVMALLHRENLVPRDLSPANFLVTGGPDRAGRISIKLCDLGLLRPAADDSLADVRSALGDLGATIWFLLTGRTEGVRELGSLAGDVSDDFRAVLRPLLAQRPEERYPTAAALLEALGEEEPSGSVEAVEPPAAAPTPSPDLDPVAALAVGVDDDPPPRKAPVARKPMRRRDEEEKKKPAPPGGRDPKDENEEPNAEGEPATKGPGSRKAILIGAAAFGGVMIVGTLVAVLALRNADDPQKNNQLGRFVNPPVPGNTSSVSSEKSVSTEPKKAPPPEKGPAPPPGPPPLYAPNEKFDREKVSQEFTGPSMVPPQVPADAPVFLVARMPPAGTEAGQMFDSIAR
jgi:serine/threonine protein kinase